MGTRLDPLPEYYYEGHPVSSLGLRLRQIRKQIEAAAERGDTKLLNEHELQSELDHLRERDSDVY